MPKQSKSQTIGREGEKWFESRLPTTWIPQRPTEDVGVDLLVVICDDGALNGLEFKVQVKSSAHWRVNNGTIAVPFRRDSLFDLMRGFTPALLVVYDSKSKRGYYAWLNQIVGSDLSLLASRTKDLNTPCAYVSAYLFSDLAAGGARSTRLEYRNRTGGYSLRGDHSQFSNLFTQ